MSFRFCAALLAGLLACGKGSNVHTNSAPNATAAPSVPERGIVTPKVQEPMPAVGPAQLTAKAFALPGATGSVTLDYLVSDRAHARVWVPVGETGSADVFDIATEKFTQISGFKTAEREVHGRKRMLGPSAATVGDGAVYIGDRATAEVCAIDEKTLGLGACLELPTPTDGVVYVASTKEVWVTTPRDNSLTVLSASNAKVLAPKLVIKTDGAPEGYAVDIARGIFYTNLEDKNRTLGIDIATHTVKTTWSPGCGADGPRGVAVDQARNFVFVACTDSVRVLDGKKGDALGKLDTGAGVDNIEYDGRTRLLHVAAAKAARLTIARIDDKGQPSIVAIAATAEGARNAVVDSSGNTYVADPHGARLLVFGAPTMD
jgi:DNA-binding beta-propeller fold protein YncE